MIAYNDEEYFGLNKDLGDFKSIMSSEDLEASPMSKEINLFEYYLNNLHHDYEKKKAFDIIIKGPSGEELDD